jgi:hypothetical protein
MEQDAYENMLKASFCNLGLLFQRLEVVFLDILTIQTHHEDINKRFEIVSKHSEEMEIELVSRINWLQNLHHR